MSPSIALARPKLGAIRAKLSGDRKPGEPAVFEFPIQTRAIAAPLQFTTDGVLGCFTLKPVNWEFLTLEERILLWDQQRARFGRLAEAVDRRGGRPLQIRRTTRPFAAYEWAARIDALASPLPDVSGADTWNDLLGFAQQRLRSTGLDQAFSAVWVWLAPPASDEAYEDLVSGTDHPRREAVAILEQLLEVESLMRRGGLEATRATAADMATMMHRSLSMGIPIPSNTGIGGGRWDQLGEFADRSSWLVAPRGRRVLVEGEHDAALVERHVVVLSMGEMPEQTWPERGADAWMMASDQLGFPVEWSLNGDLLRGSEVAPKAARAASRARSIAEHYREHDIEPPPAVARAIAQAVENLDEISEGTTRERPRFYGTIRAAVYGATADEAAARARQLENLYREDLHIPLSRTAGQGTKLREFVPGEPRETEGYLRRLPTGYLAAAMPNIDSEVGTPDGPYMGYTDLSHRAWLDDLWHGPRVNRSGVRRVTGGQGSGKSVFLGMAAYWATRLGAWVTAYDPSGALAKSLLSMPELAPYARELNLTRADEGTLTPHSLVPVPGRDEFTTGGELDQLEYRRAVAASKAERDQLLFDALRMLLSADLLRAPGLDVALQDAIRAMGHAPAAQRRGVDPTMWNPRWALNYLHERKSDLNERIWRELEAASDFPLGNLIIPKHADPVGDASHDDKRLTVITMPGLPSPPPGSAREDWGPAERYAQPLMHLASALTTRSVYDRPIDEPKLVAVDEAYQMFLHGSGRAMAGRLASDTRKKYAAALFGSQFDRDVMANDRMSNLFGSALIGRCESEESALMGCRALNISATFAPTLMALESGQFVHQDVLGRVAVVRVDMDWHPTFQKLNTTPGRKQAAYTGELAPTPFLDARLPGVAA